MKIICQDNFDRDSISDTLVCENVNEFYANFIRDCLNQKFGGEHAPSFFKVVEDDHKLYIFEP